MLDLATSALQYGKDKRPSTTELLIYPWTQSTDHPKTYIRRSYIGRKLILWLAYKVKKENIEKIENNNRFF